MSIITGRNIFVKLYSNKKVVIADKLQDMGGGEIVLAQICKALKPDFVFTSTVNKKHDWKEILGVDNIITPFWGRFVQNRLIWFLFYPLACFLMSRIHISSKESILVYSSSISKFSQVTSDKRVVLYSNYPARGVFFPAEFFKSKLVLFFVSPLAKIFSIFEEKHIKKYQNIYVISDACSDAYKRAVDVNTTVINCPIDESFYDYYERSGKIYYSERLLSFEKPVFVLASRLVDWKGLEYVLEYFNGQGKYVLNIIGGGPLFEVYKNKYKNNCNFLGYLRAEEKIKVMDASCGLVFPSVQEWSLVTIEANSLGLPVLGVKCGATIETQVLHSQGKEFFTCVTFDDPTVNDLSNAMEDFIKIKWDSAVIHKHSIRFNPEMFRAKINKIMTS